MIGHDARKLVGRVCKRAIEFAIVQHHTTVNSVTVRLVTYNGVMNTLVQVLYLAFV